MLLLCPLRLHWTATETHIRAVIDVLAGTGFRLKPQGPKEPIVLEKFMVQAATDWISIQLVT